MSRRTTARQFADAMRLAAERSHERRGTGRYRATVLAVNPLRLDLHGSDLQIDSGVTLERRVAADGFEIGDVLILLEVDDGEFVAIGVEATG